MGLSRMQEDGAGYPNRVALARRLVTFWGWIGGGTPTRSMLYLGGGYLIYLIASILSTLVFPVEVKRYESNVTAINLTK